MNRRLTALCMLLARLGKLRIGSRFLWKKALLLVSLSGLLAILALLLCQTSSQARDKRAILASYLGFRHAIQDNPVEAFGFLSRRCLRTIEYYERGSSHPDNLWFFYILDEPIRLRLPERIDRITLWDSSTALVEAEGRSFAFSKEGMRWLFDDSQILIRINYLSSAIWSQFPDSSGRCTNTLEFNQLVVDPNSYWNPRNTHQHDIRATLLLPDSMFAPVDSITYASYMPYLQGMIRGNPYAFGEGYGPCNVRQLAFEGESSYTCLVSPYALKRRNATYSRGIALFGDMITSYDRRGGVTELPLSIVSAEIRSATDSSWRAYPLDWPQLEPCCISYPLWLDLGDQDSPYSIRLTDINGRMYLIEGVQASEALTLVYVGDCYLAAEDSLAAE